MSIPRKIIDNGDNFPETQIRSFAAPPQFGEGFGQYPGISGNSFPTPFEGQGFWGGGNTGGGLFGGGAPSAPTGGGNFLGNLLGGGTSGSAGSNPLSGLNLKQISGFVDRMGGIDGILGTMGKVQKVFSSFQQMAPMMKTLIGAIGKGKVNGSTEYEEFKPRKRRRGKKSGLSRKRKSRPYTVKSRRK